MAASDLAPPPIASLRLLMMLRAIAVTGQAAAIAVTQALGVELPLFGMAAVLALLLALEVATYVRLGRTPPVRHAEIAVHLTLDLAAFIALIGMSGGASNPFTLFFVLHAVLFALLLPPVPAIAGAAAIVLAYSSIASQNLVLRLTGGLPLPPGLSAFGAWVSLMLTVIVVAWFVVRNAGLLREHHRLLLAAAQQMKNDETIMRLGALAAGAAHELASPLTTMSVIAGEIEREAPSPAVRRDAGILASQIEACRQTLTNLLAAAGHIRAEGGGRQRLDTFLESTVDRFRGMRPDALVRVAWQRLAPAADIYADQALRQAMLVLLDNAANASPHSIAVTARWDERTLEITVDDAGAGIPAADREALGRVFFTTKPPGKGTGLGLVLAANAVHALEGTLRWQPRPEGGTSARMVLPLATLRVPPPT